MFAQAGLYVYDKCMTTKTHQPTIKRYMPKRGTHEQAEVRCPAGHFVMSGPAARWTDTRLLDEFAETGCGTIGCRHSNLQRGVR